MDVIKLTQNVSDKYESFLLGREDTLFYASLAYRDMIKGLLGDEDYYLVAMEKENVVGVLPCFIHRNNKYGNVLNSLPYYGSNGGIISESDKVRNKLLSEYKKIVRDMNCVASTLIDSPFDNSYEFYMRNLCPDMTDKRRGVITPLPSISDGGIDVLIKRIHDTKPEVIRNLKKAKKNGIIVEIVNERAAFDFLQQTHESNMLVIGGPAKKINFFDYVYENMRPNKDYNLYVAYMDGKEIAALLLFYFNKTVEYYVPVVVEEYRTFQALSAIIIQAMKDALECGFENWNWGGTGMTMDGVFRFKMKWAAIEYDYNYYTNIYDRAILKLSPNEVLANYPNYYVYNFS